MDAGQTRVFLFMWVGARGGICTYGHPGLVGLACPLGRGLVAFMFSGGLRCEHGAVFESCGARGFQFPSEYSALRFGVVLDFLADRPEDVVPLAICFKYTANQSAS